MLAALHQCLINNTEHASPVSAGSEQVGGASISPDDDVFIHLAKTYSHSHGSMHRGDVCADSRPFLDGITNGYQWYPLSGQHAGEKSGFHLVSLNFTWNAESEIHRISSANTNMDSDTFYNVCFDGFCDGGTSNPDGGQLVVRQDAGGTENNVQDKKTLMLDFPLPCVCVCVCVCVSVYWVGQLTFRRTFYYS